MTSVFSLCFCKIKRVFTLEMEIFLQKELLGVNAYIAKIFENGTNYWLH